MQPRTRMTIFSAAVATRSLGFPGLFASGMQKRMAWSPCSQQELLCPIQAVKIARRHQVCEDIDASVRLETNHLGGVNGVQRLLLAPPAEGSTISTSAIFHKTILLHDAAACNMLLRRNARKPSHEEQYSDTRSLLQPHT